jgi:hypothetical protein
MMLKGKVYRIGTYEDLPLSCTICLSRMRIIAFINDAGTVMKLLDQNDESTQPTRMVPARRPHPYGRRQRLCSRQQAVPGSDTSSMVAPKNFLMRIGD